MHPADVFYGACVPQVQSYLVAAPRIDVDVDQAKATIEALLRGRFHRFCYRMPRNLGVITTLKLARDLAAPVTVLPLEELEAMSAQQLADAPGERHWHLYVAQSDELTMLVQVYDHLLCHGYSGRSFLYAALDALRGDQVASGPPVLNEPQRERYRAFQRHLTATFLERAPWATHRTLSFPSSDLRSLARVLGQPFTETATLWLARSILDVSARGWPVDASIFRMDRDSDPATWIDLEVGNRGLQMDNWEVLYGGDYTRGQAPVGDDPESLESFVRFYERFPLKVPIAWAMQALISRARRAGLDQDRERLVVNNLGTTPYPFFRTMFFDPANDVDRFGLVFVDGIQDRLELQLSPPKRFLEHFDWDEFEERLRENLAEMVDDPRLRKMDQGYRLRR